MSLIAEVGRKSLKSRSIMISFYVILSLLGITMVVPFMITLTGSTSNDYDYNRFSPLPKYLWSAKDRFVKGLVPYFNTVRGWSKQFSAYAPEKPFHWNTWSEIGRDYERLDQFAEAYMNNADAKAAADYAEFVDSYPLSDCFVYAPQIKAITFLINKYTALYQEKHPNEKISGNELRKKALELLGEDWDLPFKSFYSISFSTEMKLPMDFQGWFPPSNPKYKTYNEFKAAADAHAFTQGIRSKWFAWLKKRGYSGEKIFPVPRDASPKIHDLWLEFKKTVAPATPSIPFALRAAWYEYLQSEEVSIINGGRTFTMQLYNELAGTDFSRLEKTPFPIPESFKPGIRKLWKKFLQERFPLRLVTIRTSPEMDRKYQAFVKKTLRNLRIVNSMFGTEFKHWSDLKARAYPEDVDSDLMVNRLNIWKNFVKTLPAEEKIFSSSEIAYQKFLLKKYGSLAEINKAYGWNLKYIEEAFPPFMAAYARTFANNGNSMIFGPILDNYKIIFDFLIFNGNAIFVTLLLIIITLAFTLTVNPLAAYALSRFNIRGKNQILVFLVATMAFPAMVSAIPAYLLMRDLGLLNTFWALVIPTAANGMAIFILKGFFDSLPIELFEAATIDGASEMQIFRIIAMPMVKPILAINCLNAFIAAYNGWQWALIICQDKSMWTLAVWMYQASMWWGGMPWVVSAGFVVISIPTMLVFISCQKIILRGIIIPSMK